MLSGFRATSLRASFSAYLRLRASSITASPIRSSTFPLPLSSRRIAAAPALAAPHRSASTSSFFMLPVTSSSTEAIRLYDCALHNYTSLSGDPAGELQKAVELDPDFLLGHAALGFLYLLSTGVDHTNATVAFSLQNVLRLLRDGTKKFERREVLYSRAFLCYAEQRRRAAAAILEGILLEQPLDLLCIRTVHDVHFFNGEALSLRNSVARVLQSWEPSMPLYGRLCGMMAFGLEECNQYEQAESYGFRALSLDPCDAWAVHAIAHCYESQCRTDEGRRFLQETQEHWEVKEMEEEGTRAIVRVGATLLEHHLNWHWCLLDLSSPSSSASSASSSLSSSSSGASGSGGLQQALTRYDNKMAAKKGPPSAATAPVLNLIDDASLLWRIELARSHLAQPTAGGAAAVDPSAPVSPNYLAFIEAPTETEEKETPKKESDGNYRSRWTELFRHAQPYADQRLFLFNDAQIMMAAAAASSASPHAAAEVSRLLSLHKKKDGQPRQQAPVFTSGLPELKEEDTRWYSQLQQEFSSSSTQQQPDNLVVSRVFGDDLVSGVRHFWASFDRQKQGQSLVRQMDELMKPRTKGNAADAKKKTAGGLFGFFGLGGSSGSGKEGEEEVAAVTKKPDDAKPAEGASPSFEKLEQEWSDAREAAVKDAAEAFTRLSRARAHFGLLGGSIVQRDVFEQTLIYAAISAAGVNVTADASIDRELQLLGQLDGEKAAKARYYLQAASSLLSERVTLRFSDPVSWFLYGSVLELLGESGRAADAKNKAYSLGLGQKTA